MKFFPVQGKHDFLLLTVSPGVKGKVAFLDTLLTFSPASSALEAPRLWSWRRMTMDTWTTSRQLCKYFFPLSLPPFYDLYFNIPAILINLILTTSWTINLYNIYRVIKTNLVQCHIIIGKHFSHIRASRYSINISYVGLSVRLLRAEINRYRNIIFSFPN